MKKYVVIERKELGQYDVVEFDTLDAAFTFFMQDQVNRIIFRKLVVTLGEKNG